MDEPIITNAMLHAEDAATIERLERELAEAREERDAITRVATQYQAEAIALREDAERYKLIRDAKVYIEPDEYALYVAAGDDDGIYCKTPEQFDAAIDAARKGEA